MKIKGYKIQQGKTPLFVGVMKVKQFLETTSVDMFQTGHPEGYQRALSDARARSFGRFVMQDNLSPASILINVRDGQINEEPDGTLNLPDNTTIWIVDGQHRVGGLRFASEKDPSIKELEFPVVIMNQPSSYDEAKQFVIINKTQKGVRTDLAQRFLMQFVKQEGKEKIRDMERTGVLKGVLKDIDWSTKAIEITDILNGDKKQVWYGKIQLPNEPKAQATATQGGFTDSLEPILKDTLFQGKPANQIAAALGNYWSAIKDLCNIAFESPKEYVIQKTTGLFVLHKIFPRIAELSRDDKGNLVLTKDKIKGTLNGFSFMESEYWHSKGVAGLRGTSQKAFSSLVSDAMEEIEGNQQLKGPDLVV